MKKLILLLLIISGGALYAQDYHVKIEVVGVDDLAGAKGITNPLRNKYETYPIFDVATGMFDFIAIYDFTEEEIILLLEENGYTVTYYSSLLVQDHSIIEEK